MAYAWVEQRKCAKALSAGVYIEHSMCKKKDKSDKLLFELDQDTPITGFDVLTQNIELNFIESSKTGQPKCETNWIPVDAAKHDAKKDSVFFQEVAQYVEDQTVLFWKCPKTYLATQRGTWDDPRNCILAFEKLVSNLPFLALMPSHSASPANTKETLVFYQLADRSVSGNGIQYTTLSLLVKWFLDLKFTKPALKKLARDLVVFVHDHSKFLRYQALDSTKEAAQRVYRFTAGSILQKFSHLQTLKVSVEWLHSVKFDDPRLQTQDLARKVLSSHPIDVSMRAWYETGIFTSSDLPNIAAQFEFRINKASLDQIKISNPEAMAKVFAKRPQLIGPSSVAWSSKKRQKLSQIEILSIVANEMLRQDD